MKGKEQEAFLTSLMQIESQMPANRRNWLWKEAIERLNLTLLKLRLMELGFMEDYKHHSIYANRKKIRYAYVIVEMEDGELGGTFLSHFLDQDLETVEISLTKALSMTMTWSEYLKEAMRVDVREKRKRAYGIEDKFEKQKIERQQAEAFYQTLKDLEKFEQEDN